MSVSGELSRQLSTWTHFATLQGDCMYTTASTIFYKALFKISNHSRLWITMPSAQQERESACDLLGKLTISIGWNNNIAVSISSETFILWMVILNSLVVFFLGQSLQNTSSVYLKPRRRRSRPGDVIFVVFSVAFSAFWMAGVHNTIVVWGHFLCLALSPFYSLAMLLKLLSPRNQTTKITSHRMRLKPPGNSTPSNRSSPIRNINMPATYSPSSNNGNELPVFGKPTLLSGESSLSISASRKRGGFNVHTIESDDDEDNNELRFGGNNHKSVPREKEVLDKELIDGFAAIPTNSRPVTKGIGQKTGWTTSGVFEKGKSNWVSGGSSTLKLDPPRFFAPTEMTGLEELFLKKVEIRDEEPEPQRRSFLSFLF
ncbi:hypothetical protein BDR26DRAFT_871185 [Obelidium mucronatum]|nr:hypothetical protein BDR26DRAFT_871185 [Obelidium mucronatum]